MTDVSGRTAFITGGANGIGLGIARAFAKAGAKLALVDLDTEGLNRARDELSATTQVEVATLDVRDRERYAALADAFEAKLGPVSLLVNNAGVAGGAPPDKLTYELWDWGMDINLGGPINGVQTFLPRMTARGQGGHIVNTSSGAGLVAAGAGVLYHTAKFGVVGLSEALAQDLKGQNIGVTVLCPGPVATDIIARTRSLQPRVTDSMSSEQRTGAVTESKRMTNMLANGVPPDAVGEMVLKAVRENQLYVHTDRMVARLIEARTGALLDAMPAETSNAN